MENPNNKTEQVADILVKTALAVSIKQEKKVVTDKEKLDSLIIGINNEITLCRERFKKQLQPQREVAWAYKKVADELENIVRGI